MIDEFRFSPPGTLASVRNDDNAARALAVEWYSQELISRAAREDGFLDRTPGLSTAADGRRRQLIANKFIDDYIASKSAPTDDELTQYYEMNPTLCTEPAQMRLAAIGIVVGKHASEQERDSARKRFAEIKARLDKGADFGTVAADSSDLTGTGPNGDLGLLDTADILKLDGGSGLATLAVGQSKVFEDSPSGFRIYKVLERKDAGRLPLTQCLNEVKKAIQQRFRRDASLDLVELLAKRFKASFNMDAFVAAVRQASDLQSANE